MLEEVTVTALKRAEDVQNVPLTVNVLDAALLVDFSIHDANDLADSVPGLTIQQTPQNLAQVSIRGLGTGSADESVDQSVGLFIDGVWAGRIREFQAALFDLERVEVIKGAQTTLLGKNTSLGAISIVSRRPGDELGGYIQSEYEFEYESVYATGAIDVPTAFGNYRLAFNQVAENGYVDNQATGNEVPARNQTTLRLSGVWDVTADGELFVLYQWDDLEIKGDTFQPDKDTLGYLVDLDPGTNIGINDKKDADTSYSKSGDADDQQDSRRAVITYNHSFGEYLLTSLSGWSSYDNDRLTDVDFLSVDYLTTIYDSDYDQFSQELRFTSPAGDKFEYIVGLFYLNSNLDYSSILDSSFPPPYTVVGLPVDSSSLKTYQQDTDVWSVFGQGTLHLADDWRLTVGLRYTDEEKDASWANTRLRSGGIAADILADILSPEVDQTPLNRSEDNLDGSINLQFDINDQLMSYVSWAKASKSGGFAIDVALPAEAEYDTEEAKTVELGIKAKLAGGAAMFNASIFYTEIQDFQVTTFVGDGFLTETVPAESTGAEIETQWAVTSNLILNASATYADAQEKDTGLTLPYAPVISASFNARYQYPWVNADLLWRLEGLVNYRSQQYQQSEQRAPDNEFTLLDLRLALARANDQWEVALLARNLLDQSSSFGFDYPIFGENVWPAGTTTIGSFSRPRTIALQGRYNF